MNNHIGSSAISPPVARVLDRLDAVQPCGDGWVARCPAHPDRKPSLSVGTGDDGRALLWCHGGCPQGDVVAAIGLTIADLYVAPANGKPKGSRKKTSQPLDESLESLPAIEAIAKAKNIPLEAWRAYVGKKWAGVTGISLPSYGATGQKISQMEIAHPCWAKNDAARKGKFASRKTPGIFLPHNDGRPRLPQPGETWVLVEGAKDAALLYSLGYLVAGAPSASSPLGRKDFLAKMFAGCDVKILFDNDSTGRKGSIKAAHILQGVAASVRVAEPPGREGEDTRDLLKRLGEKEGAAAIRAAIEAARELNGEDIKKPTGKANLQPVSSDGSKADLLRLATPAGRTDQANSCRFVDRFLDEIRYVPAWRKWLVWDGRRWRIDFDGCKVQELVKKRFAMLWAELASLVETVSRDEFGAIQTFVKRSNSKAGIRDAIELARSDSEICVHFGRLDATPWLFNVENGTLDLRTGTLQKHDRNNLITKLAPVAFEPEVGCERWRRFLGEIFNGDESLVRYIRCVAGSCLAGVIREHALFFCHGDGSNGKSTFFELLLKIFGEYGMKAPRDFLIKKRGGSHPTELTDLHGARFVASVEADEGGKLNETLVKELTGGDTIRARRMREDFWQFAPTHKLWLAANHRPVIQGTDHGIWRRLKLIPFEVQIPNEKCDLQLPEKLEAEKSGVLNWLLVGCQAWQHGGLGEPEIVMAASRHYRVEMDLIGIFLESCCIADSNCIAQAGEIYKRYRRWAAENGFEPMTSTMFGRKLSTRLKKENRREGTFYLGICVINDGDRSF